MMLNRAHSRVFAITFLLLATTLTGCFGTTSEDYPEQAIDDCEVDHCIEVTIDAIECPEGYDNRPRADFDGRPGDDDVCLAYNGQIPGPTWIFHEGDTVELTLVHNVTESIQELDVNQATAQRLSEARYSLHRHGLSLDACSDGVAQPVYTDVCDSTIGPGESVVYTFETLFPGFWHYHNHAHAFNVEPVKGPILHHEPEERGLWGSFIVLERGAKTDHVFDLHILDSGPNGGLGLERTVVGGQRFDLIATALMRPELFWDVRISGPSGELVGEVFIGPGVSRGLTVDYAQPGIYKWTAERNTDQSIPVADLFDLAQEPYEGTIVVTPSDTTNEKAQTTGNSPEANLGAEQSLGAKMTAGSVEAPVPREEPDREFVVLFYDETAVAASITGGFGTGPPGEPGPGLPYLEAYAGELLQFDVISKPIHTFHLHGHPWEDPDTGNFIDTVPLHGDTIATHSFTVTAGLKAGHAGDWLYHCHIDGHPYMWGILRVYEHSMRVNGPLENLIVFMEDTDGEPVTNAEIVLRWNPDAPPDPTLTSMQDEQSVPGIITEGAPGVHTIRPKLPPGATGELVIESTHETGNSLARLTLLPDGGWVENRDVGLDLLGDLPPTHSDFKENILS